MFVRNIGRNILDSGRMRLTRGEICGIEGHGDYMWHRRSRGQYVAPKAFDQASSRRCDAVMGKEREQLGGLATIGGVEG